MSYKKRNLKERASLRNVNSSDHDNSSQNANASKTSQGHSRKDNSPKAQKARALKEMERRRSEKHLQSLRQKSVQTEANNTGLPDNLKSGVENLSGYSMDDVKVHYGSDKPAELNAYAYAQGTDIHLAPGQEKHLPHEAWHVAQQKQGRVKSTMQTQGKVSVNDDERLEKEADVMGKKALGTTQSQDNSKHNQQPLKNSVQKQAIVQCFSWEDVIDWIRRRLGLPAKVDIDGFSEEDSKTIREAVRKAFDIAKIAKNRIDKDHESYKRFMDSGETDPDGADRRVKHVKKGFNKIVGSLRAGTVYFRRYELEDGEEDSEEDSTYAYVYPNDDLMKIFLGGAFWRAPMEGYNSKPGTIIHELSHEVHGTEDHVYGVTGAKTLAKSNPDNAVTNADNYEYLAEDT